MELFNTNERYLYKQGAQSGIRDIALDYDGGSVYIKKIDPLNPPNVIYIEYRGKVNITSVPGYYCASNNGKAIFCRIIKLPEYNINKLLTYVNKTDFYIKKFQYTIKSGSLISGSIQRPKPITWFAREEDLWSTHDKTTYEEDKYVAHKKRTRARKFRGPKKPGKLTKSLKSLYKNKGKKK